MSDKRKVTTDALETLGTIIESGGRDAIHLAVEPVIAGMGLMPGQDIGIRDGEAFKYMVNEKTPVKLVGIVDPFLKEPVLKGQMFWLIVYPRQITSLRHVWEHPDFAEKKLPITPESTLTEKEISEQWIKGFAERIQQHPERLMLAAETWINSEGDGRWPKYTYDNSETYKDYYNEFPEFWEHYEIVTGRAPRSAETFFTCSC